MEKELKITVIKSGPLKVDGELKLIMPDGGMGDTFRILVQSRGVPAAHLLCQRRIGG